jgi:hypothetical protein
VVSLGGWQVLDADGHPVTGVTVAADPEQAVTAALGPLSRDPDNGMR